MGEAEYLPPFEEMAAPTDDGTGGRVSVAEDV